MPGSPLMAKCLPSNFTVFPKIACVFSPACGGSNHGLSRRTAALFGFGFCPHRWEKGVEVADIMKINSALFLLLLWHTHTRTRARRHALTHARTHVRTHARTRARARAHTHTHTHTHRHTHARTHVHTYTHT